MSMTLLRGVLIISTMAISALLIFPLRSDAARHALLSRLRSSRWEFRGTAGALIVAAAVFLLVAGIGAAVSYLRDPAGVACSRDAISSLSRSGLDGEMLARLKNHARSTGTEGSAPKAAAGKQLPDVNTMIERLAGRLETSPEDIRGWRMLGWSYFHTERYEQAATAYHKAVELDPDSAELKLLYEEAKAKAAEPRVAENDKSEATPPRERDAAVRAMVDGLADRLESSPRDVEGWTRLMRSRVVLGEKEVATTAFRKALEVFKDDAAASGKIRAAAIELGLKAECLPCMSCRTDA